MSTTKQIRIVTLFVECEKETGPLGAFIAERCYKIQGLNNTIVLGETVLGDMLEAKAAGDALVRLVDQSALKGWL